MNYINCFLHILIVYTMIVHYSKTSVICRTVIN